MAKGGGGEPCQIIWSTFEGLVLLDSLKGVLIWAKHTKGGVGLPIYFGALLGNFYQFRIFKSAGIKLGVQRHDTFSMAIKMTFYAVLSHFSKCRDLRVKVLRNCPK